MFVTDIQTKANVFKTSFTEKCTSLKYSSVLPVTQMLLTQSRLNSTDFNEDKDLKIIRALNIHKAHGHDDTSIISMIFPLFYLEIQLNRLVLPNIWKRSNIIPAHKKNDKQLVNNYRPISLLPIFGKIFEKNYLQYNLQLFIR